MNSGLSWWKGARWIWLLHSVNAVAWGIYSYVIDQWGFIALSVVTFIVDIISAYRTKEDKYANPD